VVVNVGIIAGARSIIRPGGDPRLGVVIALIFLNLAPVGLVILLAKWHGTTTASGFGLRRPPLALATGLVVAVGAVVLALTALNVAAFGVDDRATSITDRLAGDATASRAVWRHAPSATSTPSLAALSAKRSPGTGWRATSPKRRNPLALHRPSRPR